MNRNGYTIKQMLIVIIVLGVFTIGMLSFTSNAYKDRSVNYYDETIHVIEKQAALYGESMPEREKQGTIMITMKDLIDKGYYVADGDGNVVDPRNTKSNLNDLKIKLTYNNGNIEAKVIEEE